MKEWFLGKVNELGEKAVDSVINIVLSRNEKTISDFKQTPLISAISRSVNSHISIRQANIGVTPGLSKHGNSLAVAQVDLIESKFICYPPQSTRPTSPITNRGGRAVPEQQRGSVYFDGLGSIPTNMCRYSVSLSCDGRVGTSPAVDMKGAGFNCVHWNHQFIMDIDDIWSDLNLVVRAEMDFNQFSQQQQKHRRYNMQRVPTPEKQKSVNTTQISRGEVSHPEATDAQHLEYVYGKTKYVQRIGRAIISLPMLIESLEMHKTSSLTEPPTFGEEAMTDEDTYPQRSESITPPGGVSPRRNQPYRKLSQHTEGMSPMRDNVNITPRYSEEAKRWNYDPEYERFMSFESGPVPRDMSTRRLPDLVDMHDGTRTPSVVRGGDSTPRSINNALMDTIKSMNEANESDVTQEFVDIVSESPTRALTQHEVSEDMYPGTPVETFTTVDFTADGDQTSNLKEYASDGHEALTTVTGDLPLDINVGGSPSGSNKSEKQHKKGQLLLPNRPMDGDVSPRELASLQTTGKYYSYPASSASTPRGGKVSRLEEDIESDSMPTRRKHSGKDESGDLNKDMDTSKGVSNKSQRSPKEYPYFIETVVTLQLLPFHEHKWDETKFIRPVEGYPSYGMKSPTQPLGYIDVRIRLYLKSGKQLLALRSCNRLPKHFWTVPNELEMFHINLIVKRITFFFRSKPRWLDHMLLPKWPYKHPFYLLLFWLIAFDFIVLAPLPRKVIDIYLFVALVSLFYRNNIGPMRYQGLCDLYKETQNMTSAAAETSTSAHGNTAKPRDHSDASKRSKAMSEEATPDILSSRSERHRSPSTSTSPTNVKRKELESNLPVTEGLTSQAVPRESKGRKSRIITPNGYREVSAKRSNGTEPWAIFADDYNDTNLEDIVKMALVIMRKVQYILGSIILALDKLRFSLGYTDSLSWFMVWVMLMVSFVPVYTVSHLLWKIPNLVWRLGVYICIASCCFTYHMAGEFFLLDICVWIYNVMELPPCLHFLRHWYTRAPDSRETDHRAIARLQVTRN
ncbi:hypothetical protein protein, putative [Babesia ovis]|uniref:Uncharacterized protein n=1 Tax=Babesia ovis TaxID=5869 RepID=A0A9W5T8L2_BABOV|nr:hypothetical protein protein, putative [Babesia ovis]